MGCPKLTYKTNLKPVYRAREGELTREEKVSRQNPWETVDTGNYYYGARYYDPKVSVWLSVDPKAHWYPGHGPYNFSLNNPVNLVDPNGMWVEGGGFLITFFSPMRKLLKKWLISMQIKSVVK